MTKESRYELQKIDCNCNDCIFMVRDSNKFDEVVKQDHADQEFLFANKKRRAIEKAQITMKTNEAKGTIALKAAQDLKYAYQGGIKLNYGHCNHFDKEVSFQPNVLQLETQTCFVHRRS